MSTNYEIEFLKQEIATLRADAIREVNALSAEIVRLRALVVEESVDTTKHISDIHTHLWPLVHKVFPNYAGDRAQLDEFMANLTKNKPGKPTG